MSTKTDAWKQLREETLQNLDIRAKYEEFGVKFTGKVSSSNWAECYAFGRDDKTPSAGVNLTTGLYKDFTGETHSIFDFMAQFGMAESWQDAQEKLAKSVGLARKIPKKAKPKRIEDSLGFTNKVSVASIVPLARQYNIHPQAIIMTGVRLARYPANSPEPQIVCAFPIYDPIAMLEQPPHAYVAQDPTGRPINVYQGPDLPPKPEKRIVIGTTGILNKWAMEHWEKAERIYKVEGLSDMLALQNFIPEELREKHLVITNACGADDSAPAWGLANHCVGKEIVIIHDADIPGQYGNAKDQSGGAQRWVKALKGAAKSLKNVQLPYEVASKHGKDLRNWINEPGRKYSDLLEMVEQTNDETESKVDAGEENAVNKSEAELILERLELVVLGHDPENSGRINMYNQRLKRRFCIKDISKYNYIQMLVDIGALAKTELDSSPEPSPARISVKQLREAIAETASDRRISHTTAIGPGFWEIGSTLVMVGAGEWMRLVEDKLDVCNFPALKFSGDSRVIDFSDTDCRWYDRNAVESYLPSAKNEAWRTRVFDALAGVFRLWDNWELSYAPELLAGLALCSWIQDVWTWRPWIAFNGKSNCAKSTLMKFLHESYFGKYISVYYGNSTEAGLRQSIGTSSRVMLIDELEKNKERERILHWLKASGGGGHSVRGTPGQQSVSAQVKIMPWMASTEFDLSSETVRNRYLMFHMKSRTGKPLFRLPSSNECEALRSRSLAIVLTVWLEAKRLHRVLVERVSIPDVDTRYIETYSLPIAMQAAVRGMCEDDAEHLLRKTLDAAIPEIRHRNIPEHEIVLDHILTATIPMSSVSTKTVGELLTSVQRDELEILERHGLKVYTSRSNVKYLFVSQSQAVKNLLRNTPQQGRDVTQILARVEGAISENHRQRVSGTQQRGVSVPWSIISPFVASDDVDDFVPESERSPSIADDIFRGEAA